MGTISADAPAPTIGSSPDNTRQVLNHEAGLAEAVAYCLHIADAMALLWLGDPWEILFFKYLTWRGGLPGT